jgi:hypothetical protein
MGGAAFPGTDAERDALQLAALHHCACSVTAAGELVTPCSLHVWLADPRGPGHMVYARRLARHWLLSEFCLEAPPVLGGTF